MAKTDVEKWENLIEQAVRYKEQFGNSKDWALYRGYYRGDYPGYEDFDNFLTYNLVYAMAATLVPSTYMRNPYVMVSPRNRPNLEIQAKMVEAIDNWLIEEMKVKHAMKSGVLDTFLCGRGIFKVGYDSQYGFSPSDLSLEEGREEETDTQESKQGKRLEYNANIKPGMPWVVRVDPDMFLVAFGTKELDECEWVDHVVIRQLDDLKRDRKYTNTEDMTGSLLDKTLVLKGAGRGSFFTELEKYIDWVEIHEIRNAKDVELLVIADGKLIRGPIEDPLQVEGLNFVDICFNEDPEFYWAPGDVRLMEPQVHEMNQTRTQTMRHRRIALLKFLYAKGAITDDALMKMFSATVGPGVEIQDADVSRAVAMLQPHIPPDLPQWSDVVRSDVRELLGMGRQQMGEVEKSSRRTATESQIVQMAHQLRMDSRRDVVADALGQIMRKVNQIIFKYWSGERVAKVIGFDGAVYWVNFKADEIKYEYDLKVDVESMVPQTKQLRRKDLIQLIQALANNPRANLDYLLRLLLREFDWLDATKVLPEAPEMAGGQPIGMEQYQGIQRDILGKPGVAQERAGQTAKALASGVGGLA